MPRSRGTCRNSRRCPPRTGRTGGDGRSARNRGAELAKRTATLSLVLPLTAWLSAFPTSTEALDFPTGPAPYSVAVAGFNRDGKLDLVVANDGSNTVAVP